jgi:DNA replication protein DnaC
MEHSTPLDVALQQLRLPVFGQLYARLAQEAQATPLSYERYLLALAEQELAYRQRQRQQQYLKLARFPMRKELADFDFRLVPSLNQARVLSLAEGHYIGPAEPILMVGHPGLGKSHLATALGVAACQQGRRVRFYNAAGLVNELLAAQEAHRVPQLIANALKQQVIILDELGFIPFSERGAQLIFQFCSALHERVALIVTTNLRFADWTQVFGNPSLTAALLDRLTARAHILEFVGDSYRLRQQPARLPSEPSVAELAAAIWEQAEQKGDAGASAPASRPGGGGGRRPPPPPPGPAPHVPGER